MKVLVLVARNLHLNYLGCYGNEWIATPVLDRLAAEGIVFDQHYADQPDAEGWERAWRTGRYQFPAPNQADRTRLKELPDLFHGLSDHGLQVRRVNMPPAPERVPSDAGMNGAFDHLARVRNWLLRVDLPSLSPTWKAPDYFTDSCAEEPSRDVDDEAEENLTDESLETASPEDLEFIRQQDRYATAVTHCDSEIGEILDQLEQRGLANDVLLIVTSHHGIVFGHEGISAQSPGRLAEEVLHIPLFIRLPKNLQASRRVSALTQSVDLLPTLFDTFGLPIPVVHGQSLLPLARGEVARIRDYACSGIRTPRVVEWALRTQEWSFYIPLTHPPCEAPLHCRLYVKPDDPWEVNDVRQHHLELTELLEQTLRDFVTATQLPGPLQAPELPDLGALLATTAQNDETTPTEGGTQT